MAIPYESYFALGTTIGTVLVGFASFLFAWVTSKTRGPTLDFIDLTIDEKWGEDQKFSRDGKYHVRKIGFRKKDIGEVEEKSSNFIQISSALINTGDRACHFRILGMRLRLCFNYEPTKKERSLPGAQDFSGKKLLLESKMNLTKFRRRHIKTTETEVIKNRILLPPFAKDWYVGDLEIAAKYWDHKGKCRLIYSLFEIEEDGSTTGRENRIRRLPESDIMEKRGFRRRRVANRILDEIEEEFVRPEHPKELHLGAATTVEAALKDLGVKDLDEDNDINYTEQTKTKEYEEKPAKPIEDVEKEVPEEEDEYKPIDFEKAE